MYICCSTYSRNSFTGTKTKMNLYTLMQPMIITNPKKEYTKKTLAFVPNWDHICTTLLIKLVNACSRRLGLTPKTTPSR